MLRCRANARRVNKHASQTNDGQRVWDRCSLAPKSVTAKTTTATAKSTMALIVPANQAPNKFATMDPSKQREQAHV